MRKLAFVMLVVVSLASPIFASTYSDAVQGLNPVAYFKFDNATAAPGAALVNYGTAGATLNGTWGNTTGNALSMPTAGQPGPVSSTGSGLYGMGSDNLAGGFAGGYYSVDAPFNQVTLGGGADQIAAYNSEVITVSMWFRSPQIFGGMWASVPDVNNTGLFFGFYDTYLTVGSGPDVSPSSKGKWASKSISGLAAPSPLNADTGWHNIVVTRTSAANYKSGIEVYIDGVSQNWSTTASQDYWSNSSMDGIYDGQAKIGSFESYASTWGWWSFGGNASHPTVDNPATYAQIDEVAVWNSALSASDVSTLWTAAHVPEPATMTLLALGGMALLRRRK